MIAFFKLILYVPIYNVLIFITSYIPHSDVGLGIIGVTFLVRLVIFPLSLSAVRTQRAMQAINPEIKALQSKYKDDKETQAKETMALYKKYGVRPFASILTVFIQLPILISLYFMVRHESLTAPNLILAVLAAASQFAQAYFAFPIPPKQLKGASTEGMQAEFGRAMALQMRFVYPIVYGVIGYTSGAIALYFITGNIFTILQELYVRATPKKTQSTAAAVS
jgi:YidC/Oxa1 family membrane protein insertase